MGFNCLKATATSGRQFTFYHSVPRNSWCSFYRPRKDGRLSRPWSHPVVLITGPLDWKSSALTTRPLLHKQTQNRLTNYEKISCAAMQGSFTVVSLMFLIYVNCKPYTIRIRGNKASPI